MEQTAKKNTTKPVFASAKSVAVVISFLRAGRNWTQEKLGEITGISQSSISEIENKPTRDIELSKLNAIAKAFGVSGSALLRAAERIEESLQRFNQDQSKLFAILETITDPEKI